MMSKKTLLISQYFVPDINAAAFRVYDLYNALEKLDYDITVITAYPQKSAVEKINETNNIYRLKLEKINKKSFLNYLKNYFGFMLKSISHSLFFLRKAKYEYVIVTSPPLFVALGGYIISFFKKSKFILDIRDIWPDSAVAAGMLKREGLLYWFSKKIERFLYKKADIILCVSKPMKEYIYNESNHENIQILYNGISPESLQGIKKITDKESRNSKITVGYAGNIGIVQNLDLILKAAQSLPPELFEFVIIGDGIERNRLEKEVEKQGVKNVLFTGPLTKGETFNKLSQTDVLFFSLSDDPTFEKTIPSKLFDYLLTNKFIITSIKGEGKEILLELGCALFFNPNDAESLIKALAKYKNNKENYDRVSKGNRDFVVENYNREDQFKNFFIDLR